LTVTLKVKYDNTVEGPRRYNRPGLIIHCYDFIRRPVGDLLFGSWLGTSDWETVSRKLTLPKETREIVIQIGLNGATGRLCVDDLKLTPTVR
jgi:protein-L-isoaspartate(D-aspartate) O-methyltransferase